ncbi:MAG: hypothetical protein HRT58_00365 [Crocinitomicaceae bacterium]|nr:hypothetical protein [Flavobacteriales bacterium]NQZ34074.1 hypothetical protein [Crocinitomicaceae bacterium]
MLNKKSQEYISNGHYRVDGEDYMSIWTYKNKKSIEPNDTKSNGSAGMVMYDSYASIESKPDFGNFDKIYVFRMEDLDRHFKM